jgi:twitching motility protein PilT
MATTERTLNPHVSQLIDYAIAHGASDLHLIVGVPPVVRRDGKLLSIANEPPLTAEAADEAISSIMLPDQRRAYLTERELDFSFGFRDMRFRVNSYFERGRMAASLRLIPSEIADLRTLRLPPVLERFTAPSQGFVIITGPTGHGKSTTLAALIQHINVTRSDHIVTIEDPIEYLFPHKRSMISQREVGSDTASFAAALRSVLREDPNVILVGEMRDTETMEAALTAAETGHLVFATLHSNSAEQTTDRIVDSFPPHQQSQIRLQLANVLLGIVSQRLIPRVAGGRIVAAEILTANGAVRTLIREGKTHQIGNVIKTSASDGMINLDKVLAELVSKGEVTIDDALVWADDPKQLKMSVF